MGLCKCSKRKVTNQFCYEHKVNVCEDCMVTNHQNCVVLSYLKWLQDGDYNPICELCSSRLDENECIRLVCYHVFHWHCLDEYGRQMPGTMAPAGYTCPSCKAQMFPPANLVSPVADVIRRKFETVNWARTGLGLSLLIEEEMKEKVSKDNSESSFTNYDSSTVIEMEGSRGRIVNNENKQLENVPRRLTHVTENLTSSAPLLSQISSANDHDDNKYHHHSGTENCGGWLKRYLARSKYFQFYSRRKYRRLCAITIFLFIGFFILMLIFGGGNTPYDEVDPAFDPAFNPNIHFSD